MQTTSSTGGFELFFVGLTMRKTKEQKEIAVKRDLSVESVLAITIEIVIFRSAQYLWVKYLHGKGKCYKRLQDKDKRLEEMVQIYNGQLQ